MQPILITTSLRVIALVMLTGRCLAQSGWTWQNPQPQGNSLNDVQAVSTDIFYAVGDKGTVLKSVTGGASWDIVTIPCQASLTQLKFLNEDLGWVKGSGDGRVYLYQTTNGGASWIEQVNAEGSTIGFDVISSTTEWIAVDSVIIRTTNGGSTWSVLSNTSALVSYLHFSDANNGWALAGLTLLRSTNGGTTWQQIHYDSSGYHGGLQKIAFVTPWTGWLVSYGIGPNYLAGFLYATTDGGNTWQKQLEVGEPFVAYQRFSDFEFENELLGWAITSSVVYRSTNGGGDWNRIGGVSYLKCVSVLNDSTLIGAGHAGVLYQTNDSGSSWQKLYSGSINNLIDLIILDSNKIFAAGDSVVLRTTDGGLSWVTIAVPTFQQGYFVIRSIWFVDSLKGWAGWEGSGGWGGLIRTTDGGLSWSMQVDSIHRVFKVFFLNDSAGWFGSFDKVYATTNGGESWSVKGVIQPTLEVETIYFTTEDSGWAGGYIGLAKTTDGGGTWNPASGVPADFYVKDIRFIDHLTGFLTGYSGNDPLIVRTTDGGESWVEQPSPLPYASWPQSIDFVDRDRGVVVGYGFRDAIAYTTDGGEQWRLMDTPARSDFTRVKFSGDHGAWLLGSNGKILHATTSTVLSVEPDERPLIPGQFVLMPNYPNPFNPTTTIEYTLPRESKVTLRIYNVLGQAVETLVDEIQSPGHKAVSFNAGKCPSGVYYYNLQAGTFIQTRKFLLIR